MPRSSSPRRRLTADQRAELVALVHRNDVGQWAADRLGAHLWSRQREIAASVVANRYTAVPSAHATGKSFLAAVLTCWWLMTRPVGDAFVVTTAPTAAQVEAILWRYIAQQHRDGKLRGQVTHGPVPMWKVDGEIIGIGRSVKDNDPTAFQGIHARRVLVIVDEACGVADLVWNAVDSLVTNDDSRVLAIGNPDIPGTQFDKACRPGSGWETIRVPAASTPNFTDEQVPDTLRQELISPTWVEERKVRWGESSPLYASKVLGEFPNVSDDTLIQPSWVRHAHDQSLPGLEHGQFGVDIARYGTDESIVARDRGGQVRIVDRWAKLDTMATAGRVAKHLQDTGKSIPAVMDIVGVGAGPYDRLREQSLPVVAFNAAERACEPERFANRRAEAYWTLREDMENGVVDLDPLDDVLASQLQSMRWKVDSRGRILIESKDDMRRRGLPSPDRADAVVMCRFRRPEVLSAAEQPKTVGEVDFLTVKW